MRIPRILLEEEYLVWTANNGANFNEDERAEEALFRPPGRYF
jgi:hypothetical protein